jgi:hypothetical protein
MNNLPRVSERSFRRMTPSMVNIGLPLEDIAQAERMGKITSVPARTE